MLHLDIPDTVTQALRLPSAEQPQRLKIELALALYAQGILSLGKARQLAELDKYAFGQLLGVRQIPRHYDETDLQDDVNYAHRE